MNVYIPIEIKARELEGRLLLALVAAERGHTVLLGAKSDTIVPATRGTLPPGIIHEKSIQPTASKISRIRGLMDAGHIVTAQDEEGGFLAEDYQAFATGRYGHETVVLTSRIYGWGSHDVETLRKLYPKYSDKFIATGSPRVDYWRRDLRSGLEPPQGLGGDYILVSSNFGAILAEQRYWENQRLTGSFAQRGQPVLDQIETVAWKTRMVGRFLPAIQALAAGFPEKRIVIRPHPKESVEAWTAVLGDVANVTVRDDGGMSKWIHHAAVLVHNGCTSALEAAVSGVPAIAYCPLGSWQSTAVADRVSQIATNEAELIEKIHATWSGPQPEIDEGKVLLLRERFANLEGPLASDLIVDNWETLDRPSLNQSPNWRKLRSWRRIAAELTRAAAKMDTYDKRRKDSSRHKFPDLREDEIQALTNCVVQALGRFRSVQSQRVGERSFAFWRA
jgi:surface carbohydrate biosynthesis protein